MAGHRPEGISDTTSCHRVVVDGTGIFHREAGPKGAPPPAAYRYTFDQLAETTARLLDLSGSDSDAPTIHDHGAPVGLRMMLTHPSGRGPSGHFRTVVLDVLHDEAPAGRASRSEAAPWSWLPSQHQHQRPSTVTNARQSRLCMPLGGNAASRIADFSSHNGPETGLFGAPGAVSNGDHGVRPGNRVTISGRPDLKILLKQ